jgi:hypothetical protein
MVNGRVEKTKTTSKELTTVALSYSLKLIHFQTINDITLCLLLLQNFIKLRLDLVHLVLHLVLQASDLVLQAKCRLAPTSTSIAPWLLRTSKLR